MNGQAAQQAIERLEEKVAQLEARLKSAEGLASFALATALVQWPMSSQAQQDVWREHAEYMARCFIVSKWVHQGEEAAAVGAQEDGKQQSFAMLSAAAWVKQGVPTIRA